MKVYFKTFGCQMNVYDTEICRGILARRDFSFTENPDEADAILYNTCAIRGNAEDRVFGVLRETARRKRKNPSLQIGVLGCMGQHVSATIRQQVPEVDFIIGPDQYRVLPDILDGYMSPFEIPKLEDEHYDDIDPIRRKGISAWLAVSRGCNESCAYCVVPHTRGPERSRNPQGILREAREAARQGFIELNLIGQNVNSYACGEVTFARLLRMIAAIPEVRRIRFYTSHPMNLSLDLIRAIAEEPKVCPHVHLPVQSGSNAILQAMSRNYTRDRYYELVDALRRSVSDVSITTDIIAGFPGETDADHRATLELMKWVEFDSAYMFRYSPREGTAAFQFSHAVTEAVIIERLQEIIALQREISDRKNASQAGTTHEIMVEGPSRRNPAQMIGKTGTNKKVIIPGNGFVPGDLVTITVTGSTSQTLFGTVTDPAL